MRRALAVSAVVVPMVMAAVAACVGDDSTASPPTVDSGTGAPPPPGPTTMPTPPPPPSDAGGDGDAQTAWTPAVLDAAGSLALWLEASAASTVISSGKVGAWHDQSKNANHATNDMNGPVLETGVVNGHDALHFTESGLVLGMADAVSLQFGTDQIYIAAVERVSASATGAGYFFSKATSGVGGAGTFFQSGFEFVTAVTPVDGGGTSSVPNARLANGTGGDYSAAWADPIDAAKFHLVTLRRPTQFTLDLAVDDQPAQSFSTGSIDISQPGKGAALGNVRYGNFTPTVDFELAAVIIVHPPSGGVIGDSDFANLRTYLKTKYGL